MKRIWFSKAYLLAVPVLASVGLAAVWASAGQKVTSEVVISTASRYATGSLGSARASVSANQHIGCAVDAYVGVTSLNCWARDSGGVTAACSTTSSRMIAAFNSLNGDSLVIFEWEADGTCSNLYVSNRSLYAPKTP